MPVTVKWLVEGKVFHASAKGDIGVEDVEFLSESVLEHIEQSDAPLVHVLLSEEHMTSFPKSLKGLSEVAKFLRHTQLGWFIIYGNTDRDRMAIFLGSMVTSLAKIRHRRFATLSESLEHLTMVDSTLPTIDEILNQMEA